jgi:hypothetical protein
MRGMNVGENQHAFRGKQGMRIALLVLGWLLLIVTPVVGVLPGPGGVFTFAIGAGLVLKNSAWAKRRYVRLKRRWPVPGRWCDLGLRRASARRRQALARALEGQAD